MRGMAWSAEAGLGGVRPGTVWQGMAGRAKQRLGTASSGRVGLGLAWRAGVGRGVFWYGMARHGFKIFEACSAMARRGLARPGEVRHGKATTTGGVL